MIVIKVLIYISSVLLLTNLPASTHAQRQNMGSSNICGTQLRGNQNRVDCKVFINQWPLSSEEKGNLVELCRADDLGATPPIIFMTKKIYNAGEIISIRYSGACPYKTEFLIVPENNRPTPSRNTGMARRSVPVPNYEGEIRFVNDKQPNPGMYVIHAYLIDSERRVTLGGRSLPFQVRSKF